MTTSYKKRDFMTDSRKQVISTALPTACTTSLAHLRAATARNLHTEQTAQHLTHAKPTVGNAPTCTVETSHSQGWQSCTSSPAGEGRQPRGSAKGECCLTTAHFPKLDSSLLMPGQSHLLSSPGRGVSPLLWSGSQPLISCMWRVSDII